MARKDDIPGLSPIPVESEALSAYMEDKGVDPTCRRCSQAGWTIHDSDEMRGIAGLAITDGGNVSPNTFFPMIPLSCKHCGSVWLLARHPVQEWIKENWKDEAQR